MAHFIVKRTLPPLTPEQLNAVGQRVVAACDEVGITWIRSHLSADGMHSFCEFEAPDAQACRRHAECAELPVDDVFSIGQVIGPAQFG
jgi:hypothetical protein